MLIISINQRYLKIYRSQIINNYGLGNSPRMRTSLVIVECVVSYINQKYLCNLKRRKSYINRKKCRISWYVEKVEFIDLIPYPLKLS